jgi:hypothetical protein
LDGEATARSSEVAVTSLLNAAHGLGEATMVKVDGAGLWLPGRPW